MEQVSLTNLLKYCLGYVRLTSRRSHLIQDKFAVSLDNDLFVLSDFLSRDSNDTQSNKFIINLQHFYSLTPKDITKENERQYNREKQIAEKLEEIYNKYKNDEFTKQINLNFGFYEIELPEIEAETTTDEEADDQLKDANLFGQQQIQHKAYRIERRPLFSLPVIIDREHGKYYLRPADSEVQYNVGILEPVLGEERLLQVVETFGQYEIGDKFTLPINNIDIFNELWGRVCEQLRLTDAVFGESSFKWDEFRISLSPKVNYFLVEDLLKLSRLDEDKLKMSAITGWVDEAGLSNESNIPEEEELYFPLPYDKYQLKVLKLINNKASVVQGPPGTGKSQTIANILCHLAANGKRVLFVSQKAQALKVVKDKLNELKVNGEKLQCLYGYIPNLASPQIGENDELDGIAPQLAGLGPYLAKMEYSHHTASDVNEEILAIVGAKKGICNFFNKSIDEQRLFYRHFNELETLQDYAVSISNFPKFKTNFTSDAKKTIDILLSKNKRIQESISYYESRGIPNNLKEKFSLIALQNNKFSELVEKIKDDCKLSGYDGHSQLLRKLNNFNRRFRLGKVFNALPREFKDYITTKLSADISRAKAVAVLDELLNFCKYYESKGSLEQVQANLNKSLNDCGLSLKEFLNINLLIVHAKLDEIKQRIIRKIELDEILNRFKCEDHNISHQLFNTEKSRRERVIIYIQNLINKKIKEQWGNRKVRAIINTLSKAFGKSKKAYKTFDALKREPDNFKTILSLVPVWIMELEDASRLIPLEPAMFDYVIFDESSQCNLAYAMPSMFRAESAIFFGDSEQMRDDTVRFKSNRAFDELAKRYGTPQELNIKPRQEAVQSVLDMAFLRGFLSTVLQYHYRSPKELIGFSNKYFYIPKGKGLISLNTNYLTYGDTNRIMLIHPVSVDWNKEISDKINITEAEKILEIVHNLKADSRYNGKSIGILTFFNLQAAYIRKILEEAGYTEENDIKVSIIDGIQGDEKDIVIYSCVLTSSDQKKRYVSLAGEGGEINKEIAAGRVNVAFSRARMQVHCVLSMPIEKFPEGIWIDKFLKYVDKHGMVNFPVSPQPFDSFFEEEFYYLACFHLQDTPYIIQNQIKSCGFKIDFAISNPKNGRKVAIECDGPTHFKDEIDEEYGIYVDSDVERQCILEDAGYRGCFYRIKYSDWIKKDFDRAKVMREILNKLA